MPQIPENDMQKASRLSSELRKLVIRIERLLGLIPADLYRTLFEKAEFIGFNARALGLNGIEEKIKLLETEVSQTEATISKKRRRKAFGISTLGLLGVGVLIQTFLRNTSFEGQTAIVMNEVNLGQIFLWTVISSVAAILTFVAYKHRSWIGSKASQGLKAGWSKLKKSLSTLKSWSVKSTQFVGGTSKKTGVWIGSKVSYSLKTVWSKLKKSLSTLKSWVVSKVSKAISRTWKFLKDLAGKIERKQWIGIICGLGFLAYIAIAILKVTRNQNNTGFSLLTWTLWGLAAIMTLVIVVLLGMLVLKKRTSFSTKGMLVTLGVVLLGVTVWLVVTNWTLVSSTLVEHSMWAIGLGVLITLSVVVYFVKKDDKIFGMIKWVVGAAMFLIVAYKIGELAGGGIDALKTWANRPAPQQVALKPKVTLERDWYIQAPTKGKERVEVPIGYNLGWAVEENELAALTVYVDGKKFEFIPGKPYPSLPKGKVVEFTSGEKKSIKIKLSLSKL